MLYSRPGPLTQMLIVSFRTEISHAKAMELAHRTSPWSPSRRGYRMPRKMKKRLDRIYMRPNSKAVRKLMRKARRTTWQSSLLHPDHFLASGFHGSRT